MSFTRTNGILRRMYLNDPVMFVRQELKEEPSEDQAKFLRDNADLTKLYFIISAGRGSGKTICVSWLLCWAMACLPLVFEHYEVTILAGSKDQGSILYRFFKNYVYKSPMMTGLLKSKPTKSMTEFVNASVRVLTASEKSVRGPHPDMLIIDEVCAADDELVQIAMLQESGAGHGRVVMLSTPSKAEGIFADYWEFADEYRFIKVGPWPLTNCHWITPEQLAGWKVRFPPDFYKSEVLGMPVTARNRVFTKEWITDACSHGSFGINPNYKVDVGADWGYAPPAKSVQVFIQFRDNYVWVCGPEKVFEYERYPEVITNIDEYKSTMRIETFYGDSSHIGENQRVEDSGINVEMTYFGKSKNKLAEMLIMLFHNNQIRISSELETLKKELLRYRYKYTKTGKKSFKKGNDDCVDALLCGLSGLLKYQDSRDDISSLGGAWPSY